jgi:hypothetical protein
MGIRMTQVIFIYLFLNFPLLGRAQIFDNHVPSQEDLKDLQDLQCIVKKDDSSSNGNDKEQFQFRPGTKVRIVLRKIENPEGEAGQKALSLSLSDGHFNDGKFSRFPIMHQQTNSKGNIIVNGTEWKPLVSKQSGRFSFDPQLGTANLTGHFMLNLLWIGMARITYRTDIHLESCTKEFIK